MKTLRKTFYLVPLAILIGPAVSSRALAQSDHIMEENMHIQMELTRIEATQEQIRVAQAKAQAYVAKLPPAKLADLKKKKIHYLAVPTVRSNKTSADAKEVVMIWDIPRDTLVNKQVYETETEQPAGKLASFDNIQAEYIGSGSD